MNLKIFPLIGCKIPPWHKTKALGLRSRLSRRRGCTDKLSCHVSSHFPVVQSLLQCSHCSFEIKFTTTMSNDYKYSYKTVTVTIGGSLVRTRSLRGLAASTFTLLMRRGQWSSAACAMWAQRAIRPMCRPKPRPSR